MLPDRTTPAYCSESGEDHRLGGERAHRVGEEEQRQVAVQGGAVGRHVGDQRVEPGGTEVAGRAGDRATVSAVVAGTHGVAGLVEGTREPVVTGGVFGQAVGDLHHATRIGDVPFVAGQGEAVDRRGEGGALHGHASHPRRATSTSATDDQCEPTDTTGSSPRQDPG